MKHDILLQLTLGVLEFRFSKTLTLLILPWSFPQIRLNFIKIDGGNSEETFSCQTPANEGPIHY